MLMVVGCLSSLHHQQLLQRTFSHKPSPVAQSVASLTADLGVVSLINARSHTFLEIDHEIISMVILLLHWFKKGCCQLGARVLLSQACPGKSLVE